MIPFFAIVMPVIVFFCGLTLDVGMLELTKLKMQNAADAGALAAELEWERSTGNETSAGAAETAADGFTNGVNNVNVYVYYPPYSGDYTVYYDAIKVQINDFVPSVFMGALTGGKVYMSVQASALIPQCEYLSGLSGLAAYTFTTTNSMGSAKTGAGTYARCPVYINSSISEDSSSNFDANAINVTGSASSSSFLGSNYPSSPRYNAQTWADPLVSVASPAFSSCTTTTYSLTGGTATLNPGTYCGTSSKPGISITAASVTLNPGLYIVTGGLLVSASTISGTGVTMFFTKGNGASYGQVIFQNYSYLYLSAPSTGASGSITCMLFFGDRNWVHTSAQDFQLKSTYVDSTGIIYFTGTGISATGNSTFISSRYLTVVVDNLTEDSSTLGIFGDFSAVPTGNPFRTQAVLVQ